jgi:hypothetical protein
VGVDEAEGKLVKVKGKTTRDGKRILKALTYKTIEKAVESICDFMGGLKGHTFVSDPKRVICVEQTKEHECHKEELSPDQVHIRTNHGITHVDAGYTEGEDYVSSVIRRERAHQVLRKSEGPQDLGPHLMDSRLKDHRDPNNMVRDTDKMSTTSQMVVNLTDLELDFYVIPGKMIFEGYENKLPKSHKAKIKVNVFRYEGGGGKIIRLDPVTGDPKGKAKKVSAERVAARWCLGGGGYTTKDGRDLKFKVSEVSEDPRGWLVYRTSAYFTEGTEEAGHLTFSYIPNEVFDSKYPTILHYLRDISGYQLPKDLSSPEGFRAGLLKILGWEMDSKLSTKKLQTIVSSEFGRSFEGFREIHRGKPLVDYVYAAKPLRNGVATALYLYTARWLAHRGLALWGSEIQTTEAKAVWSSLRSRGYPVGSSNGRHFLRY